MTGILSGTDYVLYSKLNMSNVSLNIILHDLIAILKATTEFSSDLENRLKQTCTLKLRIQCEPTSVFHDKDGISHLVCTFNDVKKVSYL